MPHNIVRGQKVNSDLVTRSKELRRDMTPAEKILWQELRGNRLGGFHFRRQQIISRYIADFYCHAAALVVELDGKVHESQKERDQARDEVIRDFEILVMRVKNQEVEENLEEVLRKILEVCRERTQT
ncbi:MAG: DUF559 domain-containing protein [Chloroflexi bacterium]|nr:DUF559 domain-containing protein [Chloroflexota bacterium]